MKKNIMLNKKKIILYLYLLCITVIAFITKIYIYDTGLPFKTGAYIFFLILFAVFPLFIITLNYISCYSVDEEKIVKGLLLKRRIKWSETEKIMLCYSYLKICSSQEDCIKISKNSLTNNDYSYLMHEIVKKAQINGIPLDDSQETEIPELKGVGGWLIAILLIIIINIYNSFVLALKEGANVFYFSQNSDFFVIIMMALHSAVIIYSIYIIIKTLMKKKTIVKEMTIYRCFFTAYVLIDELSKNILNNSNLELSNVFQASLQIIVSLLITLIIIEYFKTSERVRHNFEND